MFYKTGSKLSCRNTTMSLERALEIACKANLLKNKMSVVAELMEFYTPDKMFVDFPFIFDNGKMSSTGRRTVLWAILTTTAPATERCLRPYDMPSSDLGFILMLHSLEQLMFRRNRNTYMIAKQNFSKFVRDNWINRLIFVKFNCFFVTQQFVYFNNASLKFFFETQINSLMDCRFETVKRDQWDPPQLAHAVTVAEFDPMSPEYPEFISHMPRVTKGMIEREMKPFFVPGRSVICGLSHYLYCYWTFLQTNVDKSILKELMGKLINSSESGLDATTLTVLFSKRVLIYLSDPTAPLYPVVRSTAHTFMLEIFYEYELQRQFQEAVQDEIPSMELHSRIHMKWENQLPAFHQSLLKAHLGAWACFYTNALIGL
jgi:hypothetical protein